MTPAMAPGLHFLGTMRSTLVLLVTCLGFGCGTGSSDESRQDVEQVELDAATPPVACTGAVYDACTDNTQCASQNCHLFAQDGIQVCTQACDAANPCPDFDGEPGFCNTKGICKPAGANACTPQ